MLQTLVFPLQQVPGVKRQETLLLGFELLFEALKLELEYVVQMALELGNALQGHAPIGEQRDQGGRGGGSAVIGYQIGDGDVVFMAHATHHWDRACRDAAGELFAIKYGQIFPASPASCQHKGIKSQGFRLIAHPFQGCTDLCFDGALHWNGHHDHLGCWPSFGCGAEHVGQGRTRHARE